MSEIPAVMALLLFLILSVDASSCGLVLLFRFVLILGLVQFERGIGLSWG